MERSNSPFVEILNEEDRIASTTTSTAVVEAARPTRLICLSNDTLEPSSSSSSSNRRNRNSISFYENSLLERLEHVRQERQAYRQQAKQIELLLSEHLRPPVAAATTGSLVGGGPTTASSTLLLSAPASVVATCPPPHEEEEEEDGNGGADNDDDDEYDEDDEGNNDDDDDEYDEDDEGNNDDDRGDVAPSRAGGRGRQRGADVEDSFEQYAARSSQAFLLDAAAERRRRSTCPPPPAASSSTDSSPSAVVATAQRRLQEEIHRLHAGEEPQQDQAAASSPSSSVVSVPTSQEIDAALRAMNPEELAALDALVDRQLNVRHGALPSSDSTAAGEGGQDPVATHLASQFLEADAFICPISLEVIQEGAILFGKRYEHAAIRRWVEQQKSCPQTRRPATLEDIQREYFCEDLKATILSACRDQAAEQRNAFRRAVLAVQLTERRLQEQQAVSRSQQHERGQQIRHVLQEQTKLLTQLNRSMMQQEARLQRFQLQSQQSEAQRNQEARSLLARLRSIEHNIRRCEKEMMAVEGAMIQLRVQWLAQQTAMEFNQAGIAEDQCVGCGKSFTWGLVSPHTCNRCKRVYCHACCSHVGAIPKPMRSLHSHNERGGAQRQRTASAAGTVEEERSVLLHRVDRDDDEAEEAARGRWEEFPFPEPGQTLTADVLRQYYQWYRICSQCYTECLHARHGVVVDRPQQQQPTQPQQQQERQSMLQEAELSTVFALAGGATSRLLTEPAGAAGGPAPAPPAARLAAAVALPVRVSVFQNLLPTFYVMTPQERRSWWKVLHGEDLPPGIVSEWLLLPHQATELLHTASVKVKEDVWPVMKDVYQWVIEKAKEKLL